MLPIVDISPLRRDIHGVQARQVASALDRACRDVGFFAVAGHGLPPTLLPALDAAAREFFALPDAAKQQIAMPHAGAAWRGWFPVGGELTSGQPDHKEGIYFGVEHAASHPRAKQGTPLHGRNLFPPQIPALRSLTLQWMTAVTDIGLCVMRGIAMGLGLPADWFDQHLLADPTVLFRIFHYPPDRPNTGPRLWGVGEHTDYGLLTLLAQDACGGLQVRISGGVQHGRWLDVPADPSLLVCNIGDMLDRLTQGRYRSNLHRVRNVSDRSRLSFPLFLDPSWDATVPALPLDHSPPADDGATRWDGQSVHLWEGRYGEYLTAKVAKVFPALFHNIR